MEQAIDYVLASKKAEGIRETTIHDYTKEWKYFTKWLANNHSGITEVSQISIEYEDCYFEKVSISTELSNDPNWRDKAKIMANWE